jgi:hypothetical protein
MSNGPKYSVDIGLDPQSESVLVVAEFGPSSSALGHLKLILSLANHAKETCTLTSAQSQALSWILQECQMALTQTFLEHSQKDS